jgi:signal transduction histidine kinase
MAPARLLRSTVFRRTLAVVLLLAGVAAAAIGLVGWHANSILTRSAEQAIETDANELKSELIARGFDGLAQAIDERSRAGGPGLYFLADAKGERRVGNLARLPDWSGAARRGLFRYQRSEAGGTVTRTAAGLLIDIDGRPRLVVGRDIEDQRAMLYAIYRSVGLGTALLVLIGLGGSLLLSRHILARIEAMSRASAGIMAGNLEGRIPVDGSADELDRLAVQLNEMLARIEQLMAGLREVSDNIAHDLKTPLNRLRNRAEAALGDSRGAEAWRDGLERVIDEADELIKTFNALLLIARLEAGATTEGFETVDLARFVKDVAELYEPVAEEAGFRLDCTAVGELPVRVNRQLVGQALANLIDNALKYAGTGPGPRQIEVSVSRSGDAAALVVADHGPGIAPEHRERALRRFVRLEQSRSQPGTGLGLSLVAAVIRLHGGTLALEDNAPGLRVVARLPLAPDPSRVAKSEAHSPPVMEAARG